MANLTKCLIKNLDDSSQVEAYFNPTEIKVDKQVPWQKHKSSKGDAPTLEFTDAEPKTLTVELLFDTFETKKDVYKEYVKKLEKYTLIVDDQKKRPPMCLFVWGAAFPQFKGVIKSMSVKYTGHYSNGAPFRCTVSLTMMQAEKLTKAKDKDVPIDDYAGQEVQDGPEGRVDNIAASSGQSQRELLDRNPQIENPRDIPAGTNINTGRGGGS